MQSMQCTIHTRMHWQKVHLILISEQQNIEFVTTYVGLYWYNFGMRWGDCGKGGEKGNPYTYKAISWEMIKTNSFTRALFKTVICNWTNALFKSDFQTNIHNCALIVLWKLKLEMPSG